jgi:hypothetical protein
LWPLLGTILRVILKKKKKKRLKLKSFGDFELGGTKSDSIFFFFFEAMGLNSGPSPWATSPALFLWRIFWDRVLQNCLSGLALNLDLPDLCLLSS